MEDAKRMSKSIAKISQGADQIRARFHTVLMKANKEYSQESDIQALRELLDNNKDLRLWQAVIWNGRTRLITFAEVRAKKRARA